MKAKTVGELVEILKEFPADMPFIGETNMGFLYKAELYLRSFKAQLRKYPNLHYADLTGLYIEKQEDCKYLEDYPPIKLNRPFTLWTHTYMNKPMSSYSSSELYSQGIRMYDDDDNNYYDQEGCYPMLPENERVPYILMEKKNPSYGRAGESYFLIHEVYEMNEKQ